MASRLKLIRSNYKVIAERKNYIGVEMIAQSPVTGNYHFYRFSKNGNEVTGTQEGYKRLKGLLNALEYEQSIIESFARPKHPNTTVEFFKTQTKKK